MRLPSLNALRAFEAAARHESFARAAEALCVTEGAVSRHVRLLEEELGVPLFRRLTRKVELTEAGRNLLPVISGAFQSMADGIQRATERGSMLKVCCGPSLSIRWLMPRLERFRSLHPTIDVTVTTRVYSWDGFLESYDVGISCGLVSGAEELPGNIVPERLLPSELTPVCAPRIAGKLTGKPIEALASADLLHSTPDYLDWRLWNGACANGKLDIHRGQVFPSLDMALKAAIFGEGVVIGDLTLMQDELASGALVMPFPQHVASQLRHDYYIIFRASDSDHPRIAAFRNWLKAEAGHANPVIGPATVPVAQGA